MVIQISVSRIWTPVSDKREEATLCTCNCFSFLPFIQLGTLQKFSIPLGIFNNPPFKERWINYMYR